MKVLMFGWEFPPFISGGLGTACLGLTQGLTAHGAEITFVLPKLHAEAVQSHVSLMGANQVSARNVKERLKYIREHVKALEIVQETIEFVLAQENQEHYYLCWSS